jgi:hypothetical protein
VKLFSRYLPLLFGPALFVQLAAAQSGFDVNIGFGGFHDKAASTGIDTLSLLSCTPATDSTCASTPSLGGFALGIGANLMLWKSFGVGGEVNFQPGKQDYLALPVAGTGLSSDEIQSRTTFYDFNGIYQPLKTKRAALQLQAGIGGMNLKFYENQSASNALTGNQNFSQFAGSSNHFQVHAGAGVQIYLTDHIFVRPQFDIHYVPNLSQFGSNVVVEGTAWVGYSFGDRQ